MSSEAPVNPIPIVVLGLFAVVAVVEGILSLAAQGWLGGQAGIGWRLATIQDYGFSPAVWDQLVLRGDMSADILRRFVTYPFVHGNFTHALFGGALLLALGKFVGDVFHPVAVLIVFFGAAVAGAVAFGAALDQNLALFGVYPPVYGLIGAFTYLMWLRLGQMGQNQFRAFQLIGFLMAVQLAFGLFFGGDQSWIADVAGFVAGLGLSVLVAPGGWAAFVARARRR